MLLTLSGRSFVKIQYRSFPLFPLAYPYRVATQLQYYIKREKCKVNDITFPSGCEARVINLGNKSMKIGIFTGGTSVRSKNISTDISRYPTRKHEIIKPNLTDCLLLAASGSLKEKGNFNLPQECLLYHLHHIKKTIKYIKQKKKMPL